MWTATKNSKCCATCAYWAGERKVISAGAVVETPHPNTSGKCYENASKTPTIAAFGNKCNCYKKWGGLN
jgi:hypothetical protein